MDIGKKIKLIRNHRGMSQQELGIKLEINAARVTMSDEELRQAADIGAEFIIGSDAHWPSRVGDDALALAAAKRAGVEGSVVNIVR